MPNRIEPDKETRGELGGDYARDTHREGFGDDYARDQGFSGAGKHDQYTRDESPAERIDETEDELRKDQIGKASE